VSGWLTAHPDPWPLSLNSILHIKSYLVLSIAGPAYNEACLATVGMYGEGGLGGTTKHVVCGKHLKA